MRSQLSCFALFALALASTTIAAQDASPEWQIDTDTSECVLSSPALPQVPVVQVMRTTYGLEDFAISLASPLDRTSTPGSVVVRVGEFSQPMALTMAGQRLITTDYDFDAFLGALRDGETLDVLVAGELHASVPLAGSGAALDRLSDCVANAYDGPVRPRVAPPPAAPPLPMAPPKPVSAPSGARPATPIGQGRWIGTADYPADKTIEGRVRFRVSVDTIGRPAQCEVTQSSGNPWLDDHTCELVLRRARFDPALDGDGNPVDGSYSTMVIWSNPDLPVDPPALPPAPAAPTKPPRPSQ